MSMWFSLAKNSSGKRNNRKSKQKLKQNTFYLFFEKLKCEAQSKSNRSVDSKNFLSTAHLTRWNAIWGDSNFVRYQNILLAAEFSDFIGLFNKSDMSFRQLAVILNKKFKLGEIWCLSK